LIFQSILFDSFEIGLFKEEAKAPSCFLDLKLDMIVDAITSGRDEYNLKPIFHVPLTQVGSIHYRQSILQDLENQAAFRSIKSFGNQMRTMRDHLHQGEKLSYKRQKQRYFADAVNIYCDLILDLAKDLAVVELKSTGLLAFQEFLGDYVDSPDFQLLNSDINRVKSGLSEVRYCLEIEGSRIEVSRNETDSDYSAEVLHSFEKFKQGAVQEHEFAFSTGPGMNHVEAAVLDLVAKLYPEVFSALDQFCDHHQDFLDVTIRTFDREVQFYMACLEHVERFRAAGLGFCYPEVSDQAETIQACGTFDLALANKLVQEHASLVCNDFKLTNPERILVVTGPNQGGKTTFARMIGQIHFLACLGCPVPGESASLLLFDRLFTHFEKEENLDNGTSKLEDDLIRIHEILELATSKSILIMNESLSATTLSDALFLGKQLLGLITERGLRCVIVTFLEELASLSAATVSMVSTVDPDDLAHRTFKVVRKPADGLAYAAALAEQHHLTYDCVRGRLTT
jgi:hypothetical protein